MSFYPSLFSPKNVRLGLTAGVSGGLIEILWISFYSRLTGGDATVVARGITEAIAAKSMQIIDPVMLGITIHMVLSAALGILLVILTRRLFWRFANPIAETFSLVVMLGVVWGANFFVFLPAISPGFVEIVPYPVSLSSKLLFGLAAAFACQTRRFSPVDLH